MLTLKMNVCLEMLLGVRWRYRLDLRYREGYEQVDRVIVKQVYSNKRNRQKLFGEKKMFRY